jgi:hypothetical protein
MPSVRAIDAGEVYVLSVTSRNQKFGFQDRQYQRFAS